MTSPAKGVYSYTEISFAGAWTAVGSDKDVISLKNLIRSVCPLVIGLLLSWLFYIRMHCCVWFAQFFQVEKETHVWWGARMRFPSARGSSVFTIPTQLIRLGSWASSEIALKTEVIFFLAAFTQSEEHRTRLLMRRSDNNPALCKTDFTQCDENCQLREKLVFKCHGCYSPCRRSRSSVSPSCDCRCSPWLCTRSPSHSCQHRRKIKGIKERDRQISCQAKFNANGAWRWRWRSRSVHILSCWNLNGGKSI